MIPTTPANDKLGPPATPRTCVPRPPRPKAVIPEAKTSAPTPPPAPRRTTAKPSKPAPPPLPQPELLADADLVDDEDTFPTERAPQPSSEDVDIDCFTRSEPPPESRPRRKRTLLACISGSVLVVAMGLLLLARPFGPNPTPQLPRAASGAARAAVTLSAAARATPISATAPQKAAKPTSVTTGPHPKLSAHNKSRQTTLASVKKPLERAAPKRALAAQH